MDRIEPAEPYQHVIVPLDGSQVALRAVEEGRLLAEAAGAQLHLFHVESHWDRRDTGMHRETEQLADEIGATADIRTAGVDDHPVDELLDRRCLELGRAIVCMATHGRSGLGASIVGSVTEAVLGRSHRPVIVVGPDAKPDPDPVARIVACVDGSALSEAVLPEAAGLARSLDVPLWIVQVVEPDLALGAGDDLAEANYVHRLAMALETPGLEIEWEVLHDRDPADAILTHLARVPSTMAALATHGRTGLRRKVLGGVAQKVVRHAAGPVLVLRP